MLEQVVPTIVELVVSLRWVLLGLVALKLAKPTLTWFQRRLES